MYLVLVELMDGSGGLRVPLTMNPSPDAHEVLELLLTHYPSGSEIWVKFSRTIFSLQGQCCKVHQ